MLSPIALNEIQAEWETLIQEAARAESQLDWINTRLEALETVLALYSPELLRPKVTYPEKPLKVEEMLVGFPKRVQLAIEATRGGTFDAARIVRLMRLKGIEQRNKLATQTRVHSELDRLADAGELVRVDGGFQIAAISN